MQKDGPINKEYKVSSRIHTTREDGR